MIHKLFQVLFKHGRVTQETVSRVSEFVRNNQVGEEKAEEKPKTASLSFEQRLALVSGAKPMTRTVLETVLRKKSNLCVAVDVKDVSVLLRNYNQTI